MGVTIDGLELDGALAVTGGGMIKDKVVRNASCPLEAIPDDELKSAPPAFQIRGYRAAKREIEQVTFAGGVALTPAPPGAMEMKVTLKKPQGFYVQAALSFLRGVEAKPATENKEAVEVKAA